MPGGVTGCRCGAARSRSSCLTPAFAALTAPNPNRARALYPLHPSGLDSTFWRIYCDPALSTQPPPVTATGAGMPALWVEVDFPDVTARKAATIRRVASMAACCAGAPVAPEDLAALASGSGGSSSSSSSGGGGAEGSFFGSSAGTPTPSGRASAGGFSPAPGHASPEPAAAAAAALPSAASPAAPPAAHSAEALSFTPTADGGCEVRGASGYRLCVGDLRSLEGLKAVLTAAGIDRRLPTLFLSECVLVYLEPADSCAVIAWTASAFKRSVFVTYEQVRGSSCVCVCGANARNSPL